ncbi:jerky protein homolog-like [Caerostris darwini]|uniref:Jerky protein homolog-like n=1 Tax=Caerostris darwini TaxID=1538125 RepID=A0AAV4QAQ4_9ARAC|nr:jerky protein homolog-like [Caerostris darwini]
MYGNINNFGQTSLHVKFASLAENEDGSSSIKAMKMIEKKNWKDSVFKWFMKQLEIIFPIQSFAKRLNVLQRKSQMIRLPKNNIYFKMRHEIRELIISNGEKSSADPKPENFIEKFKIVTKSYDAEFLYNTDETRFI